ncbi:MAG: hypothetical protein ABIM89_07435, partial [Mycobacteriales bacterium]
AAATSAAASSFAPAPTAAAATASAAAAAPASTAAAASASSAGASAQAAPAPASKDSVNTLSTPSSPPADLTALRSDPERLARCIRSLTDSPVQPVAIDYATFTKDATSPRVPALAIVLPANADGVSEVYLVGGECGTPAGEGRFLFFGNVPLR